MPRHRLGTNLCIRALGDRPAGQRPRLIAEAETNLFVACATLVVVVTAAIVAVLPIGFIDGRSDFWQYPIGDVAEYLTGARYFLADQWRMPLLFVPALGTPAGTNIGMTDSLPLLAIVAKLLRSVFGTEPAYLSIWLVLCYVLQGPTAALALYVLGVRRVVPLVLGGLILVFSPVLLMRYGHLALSGHFLLLAALALHFRVGQSTRPAVASWIYLPMLLLTFLVHIYLFAMVFSVMCATLLHGLWTERVRTADVLLILLASAGGVALLMSLCGYFSLGPVPMKPYGEWPLDLAAPFTPGPSQVFGRAALPSTIGFESFAWCGAGAAVLVVVTLAAYRSRLRELAVANLPLLMICGVLIVFAATYNVQINGKLVMGIPAASIRRALLDQDTGSAVQKVVHGLGVFDYIRVASYLFTLLLLGAAVVLVSLRGRHLRFLRFLVGIATAVALGVAVRPAAAALVVSNFQGSSRFVWVPLYLVVLLGVAGVCRSFKPAGASAVLAAALALQIFDTSPIWQTLRAEAAVHRPPIADRATIGAAVAQADAVRLLPTYLCAYAEPVDTDARTALIDRIVGVQFLVSAWATPINSVRNSRMSATDPGALAEGCARERDAAVSDYRQPGIVTVVMDGAPNESGAARQLAQSSACRRISVGLLCRN